MRRSRVGVLAGLAALALSSCSPLQPWRHEVLSTTPDGTGGNGPSFTGSLHVDETGGYGFDPQVAVFASDADDLVAGDANGATDVFVRDVDTGAVELVSAAHGGAVSANGASTAPVLDATGTKVAFVSQATDLVGQTVTGQGDVYIHDLTTGETSLVSVDTADSAGGDGRSEGPAFSPDGQRLAFTSEASNLATTTDTNAAADVYVRDLTAGSTTLASVDTAGTGAGDGPSRNPAWGPFTSGDKAYSLAFESQATDLASPGGSGTVWDVYVRRLAAGATELLSVNDTGDGGGDADSRHPVYDTYYYRSELHDLVVYESDASNLGAPDDNGTTDVYRRDLDAGETLLLSATPTGEAGNGPSTWPVDAHLYTSDVYFQSDASDLTATDTNGASDIFQFDDSSVRLISVNDAGTDSGNGASTMPGQALGGAFWEGGIAFNSEASDLGPTDTNGASDVYLRAGQRTELISTNTTQRDSGNGPSRLALTRAQTTANTFPYGDTDSPVFESEATDLVTTPVGSSQVYMARPTGADASSHLAPFPSYGYIGLVKDTNVAGTVVADDLSVVILLPPDAVFLPDEGGCAPQGNVPDGRQVIRCGARGEPGPVTEIIAGYVRLEDAPAGTPFDLTYFTTSSTYDPNPDNNGDTLHLVQPEPLDDGEG
jgi:hypothetical protein